MSRAVQQFVLGAVQGTCLAGACLLMADGWRAVVAFFLLGVGVRFHVLEERP